MYKLNHGVATMVNQDGAWQQNADGSWSEAIPLPLYSGVFRKRYKCECGEKFVFEGSYEQHYRREHTDGKRYKRTPKGLVPLTPPKEAQSNE